MSSNPNEGFPWERVDAAKRYLIALKPWWGRFLERFVFVPVEVIPDVDGVLPYGSTTATDLEFRIYIDRMFALSAPLHYISGAIEHELQRHTRDSWNRFSALSSEEWRDKAVPALDLEINSSIDREQQKLDMDDVHSILTDSINFSIRELNYWNVTKPPGLDDDGWIPRVLGLDDGLSAENYFHILENLRNGEDDDDGDSESQDGEKDEEEKESAGENEEPSDDDEMGTPEESGEPGEGNPGEPGTESQDESQDEGEGYFDNTDNGQQNEQSEQDKQSSAEGESEPEDESDGDPKDPSEELNNNSDESKNPEGTDDDEGSSETPERDEGQESQNEGEGGEGATENGEGGEGTNDENGEYTDGASFNAKEVLEKYDQISKSEIGKIWKNSIDNINDPFDHPAWKPSEDLPEYLLPERPSSTEISDAFKDLSEDISEYANEIKLLSGFSDDVTNSLFDWQDNYRRATGVNWERVFSRIANAMLSSIQVKGQSDLSYSLRNPNQPAIGPILQGLLSYSPTVYILQDVSGSMTLDGAMAKSMTAFTEICKKIVSKYGDKVTWFTADMVVREVGKSSRWDDSTKYKWNYGWGGTLGFGEVIDELMKGTLVHKGKRYRKPDLLIVSTDCLFPWAEFRPKGTKILVVNVGGLEEAKRHLPDWLDQKNEFVQVD